jgi:hypothetical protein
MNIFMNLCASLFIMSTFFGDPHLDELKQVEKETVKRLESTYKMDASGGGGGAMYGINTVMLAFTIERPVTIDEARAILVGSMELYLENINKNKAIRPYLEEYPFNPSRIELEFYVRTKEKNKNEQHLALFSIFCGGNIKTPTIEYEIRNEKGRVVEELRETFNEAKERLNGTSA